ncbi:MAG: cofactor-independent phosphoglycerate mutase [Planctomycetota bacterium]
MKYALIIPDGAADFPLDDLGGQTPLQAALTPNADRLAEHARLGTVVTTPPSKPCGSDVCTMSLLGYDPEKYHTGRAPLEAAALGITMGDEDWVFRVNLVTVVDGTMDDHSAGHVSSAEGARLIREFADVFEEDGLVFYPGVSYRNIMRDVSGTRDWDELATTPPHDILGRPIRKHLPVGGKHAATLQRLIAESEVFLAQHEINLTRSEMGELPATHLWPWGQGRRPAMPAFQERFGVRGAMITAVDLLAGIAAFTGLDRLDVPGQTSYHDNDYAATGAHAVAALDTYDLVVAHVEAPDEAAHAADVQTKVAAIEAIDRHVVGPIHKALQEREEETGEPWRILMMPDHYTRVETRLHDPTPPPFLLAGHKVGGVIRRPFTEASAEASDLHIERGHELMEFFLRSGVS